MEKELTQLSSHGCILAALLPLQSAPPYPQNSFLLSDLKELRGNVAI